MQAFSLLLKSRGESCWLLEVPHERGMLPAGHFLSEVEVFKHAIVRLTGIAFLALPALLCAQSPIQAELRFVAPKNAEKNAGVWVDGQYLGYLKELKGDKKILLLPGQHEIVVRQDGYVDFRQAVILQPREKEVIAVKMNRDLSFRMPSVFSEIKLAVNPNRAASLWMACSWVM